MAIFNSLKAYERIARFTWGVFEGMKGPGRVWLIPGMHFGVKVDLRPQVIGIPKQRHITSDDMGVNVECLLHAEVIAEHAERSVLDVLDYRAAVTGLTTEILRTVIGDVDVNKMLSLPELIGTALKEKLEAETERWGIRILNVELCEIEPTGHADAFKHEDEEWRIRNQAISWIADSLQTDTASTLALFLGLRNIGADAEMLEQNPFRTLGGLRGIPVPYTDDGLELAAAVWIEIADGPIRWAALGDSQSDDPDSFGTVCYVPDPRVRAGLPPVRIELHFESGGARWHRYEELQIEPKIRYSNAEKGVQPACRRETHAEPRDRDTTELPNRTACSIRYCVWLLGDLGTRGDDGVD